MEQTGNKRKNMPFLLTLVSGEENKDKPAGVECLRLSVAPWPTAPLPPPCFLPPPFGPIASATLCRLPSENLERSLTVSMSKGQSLKVPLYLVPQLPTNVTCCLVGLSKKSREHEVLMEQRKTMSYAS